MQLLDIKKQEKQLEINTNYLIESSVKNFNEYIVKNEENYLFYILNGSDKWGAQNDMLDIQSVIPDAEWLVLSTSYDGFFDEGMQIVSRVKKIVNESSLEYSCKRIFCYKSDYLDGYSVNKYDRSVLCVRQKDLEILNNLFTKNEEYLDKYKMFKKVTQNNLTGFEKYNILALDIYEKVGYYTEGDMDFNLTFEKIKQLKNN